MQTPSHVDHFAELNRFSRVLRSFSALQAHDENVLDAIVKIRPSIPEIKR